MGDAVEFPILDSELGQQLVVALAQFREGLLDESKIRKRFRLADDVFEKLGNDDEFIRAVEEESIRRTRDGSTKRERAQQHAVKIPDVAAAIAFDTSANPKHRLDGCQLLDRLSAAGPDAANTDSTRFSIVINLGADVSGREIIERFDKSVRPLAPGEIDPNDISPDHIDDNKSRELFPVVAAKKDDDQ